MRSVIVCVGLPASGKSSFAKDLLKREPESWIRVNKDDLRLMLHNSVWSHENEEMTRKAHDNIIRSALRNNKNVVVDNTNLNKRSLRQLHKVFEGIGDIKVLHKAFNVGVEECLKRNALREGKARVPDDVIKEMSKRSGIRNGNEIKDEEFYYLPKDQATSKYVGDESKPKAVLIDLDGTCSLLNGRDPYNAATCDEDLPNTPVIEVVKAMYSAGYKIVFMSGREDKYREPTVRFLAKHFIEMPYELYMRPTGDSRKDCVVKEEIFNANVRERFNVMLAIDDRKQIVDHYRNVLGLTVLQCAEGDF
jgi:predicted kinase